MATLGGVSKEQIFGDLSRKQLQSVKAQGEGNSENQAELGTPAIQLPESSFFQDSLWRLWLYFLLGKTDHSTSIFKMEVITYTVV